MIPIMPTAFESLEPKAVWKHFAALAAIPRASEKEAAVRDYVLSVARRLGLESTQDAAGNVVLVAQIAVRRDASRRPAVARTVRLQANALPGQPVAATISVLVGQLADATARLISG